MNLINYQFKIFFSGCFFFLLIGIGAMAQYTPAVMKVNESNRAEPEFKLAYNLDKPNMIFELPNDLNEISGIGLSSDGRHLVAVQDEDGVIFIIDKTTGVVINRFEFWKDGDYEGAEMVGNDIFIVKSTGTIYQVKKAGSPEQEVEKFNFFLNKDNDVEGLCFDAVRNCLLLACKAKAGQGDEFKLKKGIYAFDLDRLVIDSFPVLSFSLEDVLAYLDTHPHLKRMEKILDFFDPDEDEFSFSPSAIAIHPLTGDIYITSSVGKLLLITDHNGKIKHVEKLTKSVHRQPEGLCFDANGDLYIANEGKDEKARLYRFDYKI